jgi:hypothetical protein
MTGPVAGRGDWVMRGGTWKAIDSSGLVTDVEVEDPTAPPPTGPAPAPTVVAVGNFHSNTAAIAPALPAGYQQYDVGLCVAQTSNQVLGIIPSGWAYVTGFPFGIGTAGAAGSTMLHVLWKRFASGTGEAAPNIGDSGDHQAARIYLLRGCKRTGNPWNVVSVTQTTTPAATSMPVPGATTTVPNCLVLAFGANGTDAGAEQVTAWSTDLASPELLDKVQTAQGWGGGVDILAGVRETTGTYGTTTFTLANASLQCRASVAFEPEPGGTTTPPQDGVDTYLGCSELAVAVWGTNVFPDALIGDTNGVNWVGAGGHVDDAIAAGARLIMRVTPGNQNFKNPAPGDTIAGPNGPYGNISNRLVGEFRPDIWIDWFWEFEAEVNGVAGGVTKLRNAVASDNVAWLQLIDDVASSVGDNAFSVPVPYEDMETIGAAVKAAWPWMPCGVRASLTYLRDAARSSTGTLRRYAYVDLGVATFIPARPDHWDGTQASAERWLAAEVLKGTSVGLATAGAFNIQRGWYDTKQPDEPDLTLGWGCVAVSGTRCGMSPIELTHGGNAFLGNEATAGINIWSWNFGGEAYMALAGIQTALSGLRTAAVGRDEGPYNVRNDLTPA